MVRKALGRGLDALIPNAGELLSNHLAKPGAAENAKDDLLETHLQKHGAAERVNDDSLATATPSIAPETITAAAGTAGAVTEPSRLRQGFASGRMSPVIEIALDRISPNPYQPREQFDDGETDELAASIRSKGVLQPILVRRHGAGYQLIAGERRLRAARRAGLSTVPALVRDAGDEELLELALIENEQRVELNPIESARSYARIIDDFHLSQTELADVLGRDRSTVANLLRLLRLPEEVQGLVRERRLTMGHARALAGVEEPARCIAIAERAAKLGLPVRAVERLVQGVPKRRPIRARQETELMPFEDRLRHRFATQVHIRRRSGRGRIEIEFYNADDLERILDLLGALKDV
jgi:ParB family chromosome partitioning protein